MYIQFNSFSIFSTIDNILTISKQFKMLFDLFTSPGYTQFVVKEIKSQEKV